MTFDRRTVLMGGTAVAALAALGFVFRPVQDTVAAEGTFPFSLSDAEWQKKLSPAAYQVLRHEATESPGSSPLNYEHGKGTFGCAGCDVPLFDSATKYDSGTGWPSFYQPIANAVGESTDTKLGYPRTEVHCATCGGHLGHVFDDGPQPTGLRYCMNGVALQFNAAAA